jgi:hypothetical protein
VAVCLFILEDSTPRIGVSNFDSASQREDKVEGGLRVEKAAINRIEDRSSASSSQFIWPSLRSRVRDFNAAGLFLWTGTPYLYSLVFGLTR